MIATIHAHDPGNWSDRPPDFLEELARKAIDAGADQFVGHGPHQLRGLEIYKGKPIFYSLANFIFQVELQEPVGQDLYDRYGIDPKEVTDSEFNRRFLERGFGDSIWYESVIAESRYEGGTVAEIRLYPVELGYEKTWRPQRGPRYSTARSWPAAPRNDATAFGALWHYDYHRGRRWRNPDKCYDRCRPQVASRSTFCAPRHWRPKTSLAAAL